MNSAEELRKSQLENLYKVYDYLISLIEYEIDSTENNKNRTIKDNGQEEEKENDTASAHESVVHWAESAGFGRIPRGHRTLGDHYSENSPGPKPGMSAALAALNVYS